MGINENNLEIKRKRSIIRKMIKYVIMSDENKPMEPYELFGVECDRGWESLYKPIIEYIENYNKNKSDEYKIQIFQIKEKWGGLRIYTSCANDDLCKLIEDAEEESYKTCEQCGSKNDIGMTLGGWYQTVCLNCLIKNIKEHGHPILWGSNIDKKKYWIYDDGHKEEFQYSLP